ncbi:SLC13 family permease [Planococcus lenghuensis]|uniref:Sodium-dependent dicarboxylate transporter SdcS n=1 Tax=Planococcus lenghuensis TaxID=2213202 RepID=A0A1Q2KVG3_9BACL|nr:SLC13 family permease [Planococcus lenghuensis]AQQ52215.1 citrate:succinate antiporter [Planococcus lenghuensis]
MKKHILFAIAAVIYLLIIPGYADTPLELKAFATLVVIQILWIGRVFPLAQSSIILILILSFHFFTYEETLSYIASDIVWLLFSTFIISHSFISTGLAGRISLAVLRLSRGSGKSLVFMSYVLMFLLSLMIPSNVGKGSLVASVFDSLLKNMKQITNVENLGKSLFIGISYIVAISGALVATGASSTIYTFGILNENIDGLSYLKWLLLFLPPIALFAVALGGLSLLIFPTEKIDQQALIRVMDQEAANMGKLRFPEKKVMLIIGIVLVLWSTQQLHDISIPLTGMLGAALTIMPGIGVWTWEEARKSIDWDMILFFAATIMVSGMLVETGTIQVAADFLLHTLPLDHPIIILVLLVCLTAAVRLIFVNVLGLLTILLPLGLTLGVALEGLSPALVTMALFLAGVPGFLFITQSPVHLIAYSYGYFKEKDLLKIGGYALVVWIALVSITAGFYWRFVFEL